MRDNTLIQEFIQEVRLEATVRERRDTVRQFIEVRFGEAAAAQCVAPLQAVTDPNRLTALSQLARSARDLATVLQKLQP